MNIIPFRARRAYMILHGWRPDWDRFRWFLKERKRQFLKHQQLLRERAERQKLNDKVIRDYGLKSNKKKPLYPM